jgi:hypothetical protein
MCRSKTSPGERRSDLIGVLGNEHDAPATTNGARVPSDTASAGRSVASDAAPTMRSWPSSLEDRAAATMPPPDQAQYERRAGRDRRSPDASPRARLGYQGLQLAVPSAASLNPPARPALAYSVRVRDFAVMRAS